MTNNPQLSRRSTLGLGLAAGLSTTLGTKTAQGQQSGKMPVVVELFTSQGCSSCPPADKVLGELSGRDDVIAVSFNVDYWDYLGWRDTLGSPAHTKRQRLYAANRGTRQVYTPQMIINGHLDVVGSRRQQVHATIRKEAVKTAHVPVAITADKETINIDIGDSPSSDLAVKATLWILITTPTVAVPIKRGENHGRNITYHNVVRQLVPAGMWGGKAKKITLPKDGLNLTPHQDCVALLQIGTVGRVIGAARYRATDA